MTDNTKDEATDDTWDAPESQESRDTAEWQRASGHCSRNALVALVALLSLAVAGVSFWLAMNKRKEIAELTARLQESTKGLSADAAEKILDAASQIGAVIGK